MNRFSQRPASGHENLRLFCSYPSHRQQHPNRLSLGLCLHCTECLSGFLSNNYSNQQLSNYIVCSRVCNTEQMIKGERAMENINCEENNQQKTPILRILTSQDRVLGLGLEWQQVWCVINIGDGFYHFGSRGEESWGTEEIFTS